MKLKLLFFVVALACASHSRASSDSTEEKKYVFDDVMAMLADDVCYLDLHIAETGDAMTQAIWTFFVEHVTFGVKQGDSLVFVDLFGESAIEEPMLLCIPYYDTLQMDYFSMKMLAFGEGGQYIPLEEKTSDGVDFVLLNYLFDGMSSYALRMNTLFHEAVHFWVQYHVSLPNNAKKRRVIHETLAYTLSWELTVTLLHPSVDSLFTQLLLELDRDNVPDGYYGARLPGVDPECVANEIEVATEVFSSQYVQSVAHLLLENEGATSNRWYRKKLKILKQGNLI